MDENENHASLNFFFQKLKPNLLVVIPKHIHLWITMDRIYIYGSYKMEWSFGSYFMVHCNVQNLWAAVFQILHKITCT